MGYREELILGDPDYKWSFSRIKKFNECAYGWYIKYIEDCDTEDLFFSQFGSFVHNIFAAVLLGNLPIQDVLTHYLVNFRTKVNAKPPSESILAAYFQDGLRVAKNIESFISLFDNYEIVGVELPLEFQIKSKYNFVGFIDLLLKDKNGNYIIVDHKSRKLKPRSKKGNTKSDRELDDYFKQLYLYGNAVKEMYGRYPTELWLNCFRNKDSLIKEVFDNARNEMVTDWIVGLIEEIKSNNEWKPNCDWFACTNLCECCHSCEYYQLM